jgi:hypothetical protein
MSDEIRTKIRANVSALIAGMRVSGGYHSDWGSINQMNPALSTFPCAIVTLGPEQSEEDDNSSYADSYRCAAEMSIEINVKAPAISSPVNISVDTIIDNAMGDIKRVIGRNPSFNSAGNTPPIYLGSDDPEEYATGGVISGVKRIKMNWLVPYVQSRTEPTQQP